MEARNKEIVQETVTDSYIAFSGEDDVSKTVPALIIEPSQGWTFPNFRDLWHYRELLYFLVLRDIKILYKQTVLGFAWAIIRPLFSMVVFSVVFGSLAKVPSDGIPYPLFSYVALVPWIYFSSALTGSTDSLVSTVGIFTKAYFPRMIIPLTPVLSKLVDFGIAFVIVFGLMAWFGIAPTVHIVWIPVLVMLMILTSSGIGMWLSALAIQYRDVKYMTQFIAQILMYAAPVIWPMSLIPEQYRLVYGLYPMVGVIEGFRSALLGHNPMPWGLIGMGMGTAAILFVTGALYFRGKERIFADVA